jgi:TnpA family transposase
MARLTILTPKELQAIYGLPHFTDEERAIYFALSATEKQLLRGYRTLSAKISFILQLGYFKARKMFFVFDANMVADDAAYILRAYFPEVDALSDLAISKPTRLAQQAAILRFLDYQACSLEWRRKLQEKAQYLVTIYSKPVYLFRELANFLELHRVVLPGYSFMQEKVVGKALTTERKRLETAVARGVPEEQRKRLDDLLATTDNFYQLTLLKREPRDISYQEVQKEIDKRVALVDLYHLAGQFLPSLHISNENISYYASLVSYYSVKDLKRMSREIEQAYLLCFIAYRYQAANDNLASTFIYQVNRFIDEAKETARVQIGSERLDANQHLKDAGKVLALFTDDAIPDDTAFGVVKQRAFGILKKDQFGTVGQYLAQATLDEVAYEWQQYVRLSPRFRLNLRRLFMAIPFESQTEGDPLLQGAAFLRTVFGDGKSLKDYSSKSFPQACIPDKWRRYIYETKIIPWYGKIRTRRIINADKYEFMIYRSLKEGIDGGTIFIRDSRNYKSFEEDILSEEQWRYKDELIKKLGLPYLHEPITAILERLESELEAAIVRVNDRVKTGANQDVITTGVDEQVRWHLPYHNDEEPVDHPFYEQLQHVSIVDILAFAQRKTDCFSGFTHQLDRYVKQEADIERIAACLVAFGENLGIAKMAAISDFSYQELNTTALNFIRLETLKLANDLVTNAMAVLPIFRYYNLAEDTIHGSIDGQKLDTQIDTFNARHSPKYFGLGKGVTSLTLVVNHIPVNAKIIGAHEHESYFVYDLLYNNTSDVDPQVLSTDTHGTNHVNHAILDVFGYQFAPRYKRLDSEHRDIYGFHVPKHYKDLVVRPTRRVNRQLIIEEWDNFQRIMVSLGLRSTTQSTIVRKLSSYPRKNRTKKALWEYDNIIRSLYILNYVDSLPVRQSVQKALNRGEAYHRLKREVFHAHQGKFRVKTELEQHIWDECARFLTNCIILYNAYILSALLAQKEAAKRQEEADIISRISPVAWRHVNLIGKFEFRRRSPIDVEAMIAQIDQEIVWQQLRVTDP